MNSVQNVCDQQQSHNQQYIAFIHSKYLGQIIGEMF